MSKIFKSPIWQSIVFSAIALLMNFTSLSAQSFKVSAVSDMVQVFEDGYKMPAVSDTVKLFGIRGEIISGQFVINAKKSLTNVSVEMSPFKISENASAQITPDWSFVGSIPLTKNAPNQPASILVRQAPARFPDYLMAEKELNIKEKSFQAVWLTINIPANASAGIYKGTATVKSEQGNQVLPVAITVYPLTLTADRHLKVAIWYSTGKFAKFYGITEEYSKPWFDMLKLYADNMAAHRENVFRVGMETIEIRKTKSNGLEFDFSRFDQVAQVFWSTGKMDWLETGFLARTGQGGWASTDIHLRDFTVKNAEDGSKITLHGEEVIPYLLPALEDHLLKMGWLQKTYLHIVDEPSVHNAQAYMNASAYIHRYAPDMKRMDALETSFLLDEIEVAVPKLDALESHYDTFMKWQDKTGEVWFYTVGIFQASLLPNKTIDVPLIDSRIMHWENYRFDVTGYLHWGYNQWTDDPFNVVGQHIGDGWHVYPSKDGVLNSTRWEETRNGIQDYEYFWMLGNKIQTLKDSLGIRFAWINPKQRGQEIAANVVQNFGDFSYDPEVLNKAKMQLINELMDFNKSPRLYVQTDPKMHSSLTPGSSVEVYGWTEPGTEIVVNGQKLPVSPEGFFVEQFPVNAKRNSINVVAKNSKGTKQAIRDFNVK